MYEEFITMSNVNVLRGLHFQYKMPQTKIVSVLNGAVVDVIVDLRKSSPTYLKSIKVNINANNNYSIYIPKGCAHGFLSLCNNTIMLYMCEGKYDKKSDSGIRYNDPELNIDWGINTDDIIISERDQSLLWLHDFMKISDKDDVFL